ncbi:MAG: S-methyl-5-thioribose-1-phosphate isomerase [Deltaproteobacteria bacterium]|nr:MAG: S-methyl-5-thioribose-1-phosphate isomerase [Deltaproteobacteria bacterium]
MALGFFTLKWEDKKLILLDQRKLPLRHELVECKNAESVMESIKDLVVRGAPAIGIAAAFGIVLGSYKLSELPKKKFLEELDNLCKKMISTRPTAVNLKWAVDRLLNKAKNSNGSTLDIIKIIEEEAISIKEEDEQINKKLGEYGSTLVPEKANILTHCNAGSLATSNFGTALGVIRAAVAEGKKVQVFATETRPLLQGARLTTWELMQDNIPVTLITDNMAGWLMAKGNIDMVVVGADRIAANGDTANKIGTYTLSVLAFRHKIPFYIAAPTSTIDISISSGDLIPIEYRNESEVSHFGFYRIAPEGIKILNPAFDVTPSQLITRIITEKGVLAPPFLEAIKNIL